MNKGIDQIRESIKKRKDTRLKDRKKVETPLPLIATFEEKHGFDSVYLDTYAQPKTTKRRFIRFHKGLGVAIVFFLMCVMILQSNITHIKPAKSWLASALEDEFPFAKVMEWYTAKLGSPLALTPEMGNQLSDSEALTMPVDGEVVETFMTNGEGIFIAPKQDTAVRAIKKGIVIFVGNDKQTDKTIVVQHADDSLSTYGFLSKTDVFLYQYINPVDPIGEFHPVTDTDRLYFSIEKENEYIDPAQVIPVDVQP